MEVIAFVIGLAALLSLLFVIPIVLISEEDDNERR